MNISNKLPFLFLVLFTIYSCAQPAITPTSVKPISTNPSTLPSKVSSSINPESNNSAKIGQQEYMKFNGTVYDRKGNKIDKAVITAKTIDSGFVWSSQAVNSVNGDYTVENAPVGVRLSITATKDGMSKTRTEVVTTNLKDNPLANTFDFDSYYSLDSTMLRISLFNQKNEEIKDAAIKIESLDPSFPFSKDYDLEGSNTLYTSSKEVLPINIKFKITVKANNVVKERTITTQPSLVYNDVKFGGTNGDDASFALG